MDGNSIAETIRKITPGYAGTIAEDDGIREHAIVHRCATNMAVAAGQEVLDLQPLIVAQSMAMHVSASQLPTTQESEKNDLGIRLLTTAAAVEHD